MKIINNNDLLTKLCNKLKKNKYIVIDTEFARSHTYYPILCLIQIATDDEEFIIDCLAPDFDISILSNILFNKDIIKIFHDCKQDIDVVLNSFAQIIYPIFDTQIAANICNMGKAESLASLAEKFLGVKLDKNTRYSNWCLRPLSEEQLDYAANDVIYLRDIYHQLNDKMDSEKLKLMNDTLKKISNPKNYVNIPEDSWKRIKIPKKNNPSIVASIKKLAAWREINAQKYDIPRKHLLKDHSLIEIAKVKPITISHLKKINDINQDFFKNGLAEELMLIILDTSDYQGDLMK